jgi:putative protease
MRFKLPENYNFTFFSDSQNGNFKALSTEEGSYVFPENPFSIADKAPFIKKNGFNRLLIDFSKTRVSKQDFRMIMDSYRKGLSLPDISRFNWKDGFYDPDRMEELKQMTERANFRKVSAKKTDGKGKTIPGTLKKSGVSSRTPGKGKPPAGRKK